MPIRLSAHARDRMKERGATLDEIEATIEMGSQQVVSATQSTFIKCFDFCQDYHGAYCHLKHITVHAVYNHPDWVVKTVIVTYSR